MTQAIAINELDGLQLANALRAGIYRLFERTDHINKINVFPVPDGDTGTNMSMTLSAVLAAIDRAPEPHAGTLLVRAADAALDGARGNSGAILAQFLLGLGDGAGHLARLGRREFVAAVNKGSVYARDALSQPREGTILTVLREFAQASEATLGHSRNFGEMFSEALVRVRSSLEATRSQLDELRIFHHGQHIAQHRPHEVVTLLNQYFTKEVFIIQGCSNSIIYILLSDSTSFHALFGQIRVL